MLASNSIYTRNVCNLECTFSITFIGMKHREHGTRWWGQSQPIIYGRLLASLSSFSSPAEGFQACSCFYCWTIYWWHKNIYKCISPGTQKRQAKISHGRPVSMRSFEQGMLPVSHDWVHRNTWCFCRLWSGVFYRLPLHPCSCYCLVHISSRNTEKLKEWKVK